MQRHALITGGNRGLGLETARRLSAEGVAVIVAARDEETGERAAAELREQGGEAEFLALDVTAPESVAAAAREVERRHGRLDILVNNAGILPEATESHEEPLDLDLYRRTFETNVFGAVAATQEFLPLLRRSEAARIVNVSSTMGSLSDQLDPDSQYFEMVVPGYQGSKAAVNALTVALSKALADDPAFKVNSVCPGWLQTDLGGDENRAAAPDTAEEGAKVVAEAALLPADGPTGGFFDREGPVAW